MKKREILETLRSIEQELKQQGLRVKTDFAGIRAEMNAGHERLEAAVEQLQAAVAELKIGLARQVAATDQLEAKLENHITTTTEQVGKVVGVVNSIFDSLEDWKAKVDRDHASLSKRVAALEKKSA